MSDQIFEIVRTYPDHVAQKQYDNLVGIDHIKNRLKIEAAVILNPAGITAWSENFYKKEVELVKVLKQRPPLFIFAGDVGTGKTALAESFANEIANTEKVNITLFKLSLSARGSGIVGEITKLISESFDQLKKEAQSLSGSKSTLIFFIDEADALAQSREASQMHHEDKAGVNALIRGIDSIKDLPIPVLVIMCTNRHSSIDPAIRRRSAVTFEFSRPSQEQCFSLFKSYLSELSITDEEIKEAVSMCVPYDGLSYGYTYSDLTQKVLPSVLLNSYPNKPVTFETLTEVIKTTAPTTPFNEYQGS